MCIYFPARATRRSRSVSRARDIPPIPSRSTAPSKHSWILVAGMADSWFNSSPSKKAITKEKAPPLRHAYADVINAWSLRPRITEPDNSITITDKLLVYVRFDAEHPCPGNINDLIGRV